MIPHGLVTRVVIGTGVDTMVSHLSAHVAVSSSMVVAGFVCVDGVVPLSAHVENEVAVCDALLVGAGEDEEGVGKRMMGCASMCHPALSCRDDDVRKSIRHP